MEQRKKYDAVVVGAGVGGLSSAVRLRQLGLRVVCIEPQLFPHAKVGESLDWSAPALLAEVGISRDRLVEQGIATYKKKITVNILDNKPFDGIIAPFLAKRPLEFEILTIHADRVALDQQLFDRAREAGVEFFWSRVIGLKQDADRVLSVQTAKGRAFSGDWFIDASGQARVFAQQFNIPKHEYGKRKIALWAYLEIDHPRQGTSFFLEKNPGYLNWIWEIPIRPGVVSVGFVIAADQARELLKSKDSIEQIFIDQLLKFPRFQKIMPVKPDLEISRCSFHGYLHDYVCGLNWFMIGEAASLPDPLTSNGFTAAMRHAREAVKCIQLSLNTGEISEVEQSVYGTNVKRMGHAFNASIEMIVYDERVRRVVGVRTMMRIYTLFGVLFNAIYSKFSPRTSIGSAVLGGVDLFFRIWRNFWWGVCSFPGWIDEQIPRKHGTKIKKGR